MLGDEACLVLGSGPHCFSPLLFFATWPCESSGCSGLSAHRVFDSNILGFSMASGKAV